MESWLTRLVGVVSSRSAFISLVAAVKSRHIEDARRSIDAIKGEHGTDRIGPSNPNLRRATRPFINVAHWERLSVENYSSAK